MKHFLVLGKGPWGNNITRDLRARDARVTQMGSEVKAWAVCPRDYDAVFIATPLASHFELAQMALVARRPTWIEKPAVRTAAEWERLVAQSKEGLFVDYTLVHHQGFHALQRHLAESHDAPSEVYVTLGRKRPERLDCNLLWDWSPHFFAAYFTLAPWVTDVSVSMRKDDDFLVTVAPATGPGPIGVLELNVTRPEAHRSVTIMGAYGQYQWQDCPEGQPPVGSHAPCVTVKLPENGPQPLELALECFLTGAARPVPEPELTRRVMKALEQLGDSAPQHTP